MGSFTRAASSLNVAQPALSRQIRLLEVELRQNLLVRNGRGAVMTEAGKVLLEHGRGAEVAAAVAGRGHATLVRGTGGPVFPPEAAEVAALAAGVKARFDPRGILNRGMMG